MKQEPYDPLAAVMATALDAVIILNYDGEVVGWNAVAERMFEWQASDALGRQISELIIPEGLREAHHNGMRRLRDGGEPRILGKRVAITAVNKSGSEFPVELSIVMAERGAEPVFLGFVRDLSEQKKAEEKVAELQAEIIHLSRLSAMGSMAATLAHEVNQPLTAAANFAAGLRRHLATNATPEDLLSGISGVEAAVLRAGDIIRRLRLMVEGKAPHMECVLAGDVVTDALRLLREPCSRVMMRLDIEEGSQVMCDPVQIQQVLVNLVRNACEAVEGEERPSVSVTVTAQGERVQFCVADNGPGIKLGEEAAIFDAFVTSKEGGMGIGLAISRTIVESHRGSLKAETLEPQGARFCFELPVSWER